MHIMKKLCFITRTASWRDAHHYDILPAAGGNGNCSACANIQLYIVLGLEVDRVHRSLELYYIPLLLTLHGLIRVGHLHSQAMSLIPGKHQIQVLLPTIPMACMTPDWNSIVKEAQIGLIRPVELVEDTHTLKS